MHPYATLDYAQSLSHWGKPLYIPEWKTGVLVREIKPGFQDASGTYPITILDKEIDIPGGLARLRSHQLVSVVLILDDFHRPSLDKLACYFNLVKLFKTHYIFKPAAQPIFYNRHHRYELRQALKTVRVAPLDLEKDLERWCQLYSYLIQYKKLTGLHTFSLEHHKILSKLKNVSAIGAWKNEELISCHIWFSQNGYFHSHLAASNTQGYTHRAAYAVNDAALRYFAHANIINFGGGAGHENSTDGLVKFKQGFSNATANSYICGAILDEERYAHLVSQHKLFKQTDFFPAYRALKIG